jgi:hypothetical protein
MLATGEAGGVGDLTVCVIVASSGPDQDNLAKRAPLGSRGQSPDGNNRQPIAKPRGGAHHTTMTVPGSCSHWARWAPAAARRSRRVRCGPP